MYGFEPDENNTLHGHRSCVHVTGLEITDAHVTAVNGVPVPDDASTVASPIAPAAGPVSGPVSGAGQSNSAQAGSGPSPAKLTYIVAGMLAAYMDIIVNVRVSLAAVYTE